MLSPFIGLSWNFASPSNKGTWSPSSSLRFSFSIFLNSSSPFPTKDAYLEWCWYCSIPLPFIDLSSLSTDCAACALFPADAFFFLIGGAGAKEVPRRFFSYLGRSCSTAFLGNSSASASLRTLRLLLSKLECFCIFIEREEARDAAMGVTDVFY